MVLVPFQFVVIGRSAGLPLGVAVSSFNA